MNWQSAVEKTVVGLGYDLVDASISAGGLLRVSIDHPPAAAPAAAERFITVDDCEKVTRQLQYVLEVDAVPYERLEVSSPGLDRPLKKAADYERFAGEQVELTLKEAFAGRKKFSGELRPNGDGWRLVLAAPPAPDRRARRAAAAAAAGDAESDTVLDFSLDEVREARLVPVVDFKGRRFAAPDLGAAAGSVPAAAAGPDDELDGGRVQ